MRQWGLLKSGKSEKKIDFGKTFTIMNKIYTKNCHINTK